MSRRGFKKKFPMFSIIPQKMDEKRTHKECHIDTTKLPGIGVELRGLITF